MSKCICPSTNARRCFEIRYPPPTGDFERSMWFEDQEIYGSMDECECGCHEPDEYQDENEPERCKHTADMFGGER